MKRDRISSLPDSIIHHILSFMYTLDAVKTCVLSKRWRYIWTSLPVLKFENCLHYNELELQDIHNNGFNATKRFRRFVDKVLSLREKSDMQRFVLECSRYYRTNDKLDRCINRWIADAVTHKVQELSVELCPDDDFEIPPCLCTCKSLTQLDLDITTVGDLEDVFNKIILPREMGLPRLKSLRLRLEQQSFVNETLTNKFFSSFLALESLVIVFSGDCGFSNMNLKISLPELKHFEFNSNYEVCNSEVTLHAPSLSSFIFKSYASTSFTIENLQSLVTADIEVSINGEVQVPRNYGAVREEKKELYAQRFMRFFRGLHKVKVLKLGQSFVKALGGAPHILDTQLIEFSNLRSLKMRTFLSWDCLHSIFYLLKISPNIESISLKLFKLNCDMPPPVYPLCDEVKINPENIGDYWDARLSLPCMMCHLKFVEIEHLGGCVNELKFLEILLKHAMVLEKVVLRSYSAEQDSEREIRMAKFGEMVLGFPRASKYMIILCKSLSMLKRIHYLRANKTWSDSQIYSNSFCT